MRIVLALILFAAYGMGYFRGIVGYLALLIGLILILTGVFGTFPIYGILGIRTDGAPSRPA